MLNRQKLLAEIKRLEPQLFAETSSWHDQMVTIWHQICQDTALAQKIASKKWPLQVPDWKGMLGYSKKIVQQPHPYQVLAVDGSQIYYDKHQGPACFLLNVGSVFLEYGIQVSRVILESQPEIVIAQDGISLDQERVNLQRELQELTHATLQSVKYTDQTKMPYVCLFDGTLIFFQVQKAVEDDQQYFTRFMEELEKLYQHRILHGAYMSFPKTKEILNVVRLVHSNFNEKDLVNSADWQVGSDMDVLNVWLPQAHRSIVFQSKAPITYQYPVHLKPYFCYLRVSTEIVRLEFPAWIAQDETLVDQLCAVALDQADKGQGYPVALFEAHEQSVVKAAEREYFYATLRQIYEKQNRLYAYSVKSARKKQVPI